MKLYAARDKNNQIYLYSVKPTKDVICWCTPREVRKSIWLDEHVFPEVKWEDKEPTEVELVIKNK